MKFLETLSYIYFGCPKSWKAKPFDKKKRFIIKMMVSLLSILLFISVGIIFIYSGMIFHGIVLISFAVVVYILSFLDFRKRNK